MEDASLNAELTQELEQFLAAEHAMLVEWREAVREMRARLLSGEVAAGTEALVTRTRGGASQQLRRVELQRRLGKQLRIAPSEVQLSQVEMRLDDASRRRVASQRRQLQSLLREIRAVTNANAALVLQTTEVLNRAIQAVTRSPDSSDTYDAAGRLRSLPSHSVLRHVC